MNNKDLPAMPFEGGANNGIQPSSGMTKREYFAAHAPDMPDEWLMLREQQEGPNNVFERLECRVSALVAWRWHYADMMLESDK